MILAGAVNNIDYFSAGVSLDALGMNGMNKEQINAYLLTGES
jgi:hypothetical protein